MSRKRLLVSALVLGLILTLTFVAIAHGSGQGASPTGGDAASVLVIPQTDKVSPSRLHATSPFSAWTQVNVDGFGNPDNEGIASLTVFSETLYAGTTYNLATGAEIWRMDDGWTPVITGGLGHGYNYGVDDLTAFKGTLYASTWAGEDHGGEIWRSDNGIEWTRVVSGGFSDPTNGEIMQMFASDNLYAGTCSYTVTHGAEIWRSSSGDAHSWNQVVADGFNADTNNLCVASFELLDSYLYAGTLNYETGGETWRTMDGTTWEQANSDGFGSSDNGAVSSFAVFGGKLYAGTWNPATGAQVWRCSSCGGSDWEQVVGDGFGSADNLGAQALILFEDWLYCITQNGETGVQVWRTDDGVNWEQAAPDGFGDSSNFRPYWDNSVAVFEERLFVGTHNPASGGEIWMRLHQLFLPLVIKK